MVYNGVFENVPKGETEFNAILNDIENDVPLSSGTNLKNPREPTGEYTPGKSPYSSLLEARKGDNGVVERIKKCVVKPEEPDIYTMDEIIKSV